MTTVEEVSEFDNNNMFCRIKGCIARQRHGCPMGGYVSPGKAMVTLSQPEGALLQRVNAQHLVVICCRYMDDVALMVAFEDGCVLSEEAATELCDHVRQMYPPPLELKCEPESSVYRNLDTEFMVNPPNQL